MDTETMISELKSIEEKHKHDKVFTGQLNIAEMACNVRKKLEELKSYEDTGLTPAEIRELNERDTAKGRLILMKIMDSSSVRHAESRYTQVMILRAISSA